MREFIVDRAQDGRRLDRWLSSELPALPKGLAQKYIRLKRVKLNGKGAQQDTRLHEGDRLQLYIGDEFFEKPKAIDPFLSKLHPKLDILYAVSYTHLVEDEYQFRQILLHKIKPPVLECNCMIAQEAFS